MRPFSIRAGSANAAATHGMYSMGADSITPQATWIVLSIMWWGASGSPATSPSAAIFTISVIPPTRTMSGCRMSAAPARMYASNSKREPSVSPMATGMSRAAASRAWTGMSSQSIGSSNHATPSCSSSRPTRIAVGKSHFWLASTAIQASSPRLLRTSRTRWMSFR